MVHRVLLKWRTTQLSPLLSRENVILKIIPTTIIVFSYSQVPVTAKQMTLGVCVTLHYWASDNTNMKGEVYTL